MKSACVASKAKKEAEEEEEDLRRAVELVEQNLTGTYRRGRLGANTVPQHKSQAKPKKIQSKSRKHKQNQKIKENIVKPIPKAPKC